MKYRRLGKAGVKLSAFGLGSWLTFGDRVDLTGARELMASAKDHGVNHFDNAEIYGEGLAELIMGEAARMFDREEIVITSKVFFGTGKSGPNNMSHCRKRLFEGTHSILRRMQLDHVDILYCHRPDSDTPIEETVTAMNDLVRSGKVMYWGTSEWEPHQVKEAYRIAQETNSIPPSVEQPQYNMFVRDRVEQGLHPLCEGHGLGLVTFSPLASGLLTGKYQDKVPSQSRMDKHGEFFLKNWEKKRVMISKLSEVAKQLRCSLPQLALAWCSMGEHVCSVLIGASSKEQLLHNLEAVKVQEQLTPEWMARIVSILNGE